jgi:hypothetical protein
MVTDMREMLYSTDSERRRIAAKGLAGTLAGIFVFHYMRRFFLWHLGAAGVAGVYAMMGVDADEKDDEEKKKELDFKLKQYYSEVTSNILLGGAGSFMEKGFLNTMNRVAYFVESQAELDNALDDKGNVMTFQQYKRQDRAPFYTYEGKGTGLDLGLLTLPANQLMTTLEIYGQALDPDLSEKLTPEEQRYMYLAALSSSFLLGRVNDTDVDRIIQRGRREMLQNAKQREKEIRAIRNYSPAPNPPRR